MDFTHLDDIYKLILSSKYDQLTKYNNEDIEIVCKLRFPALKLPKTRKYLKDVRTNGHTFRKNVITSFNNKCALTNITSELCEAAHILPYKYCNKYDKYSKYNGLLLSANMHKAFDKNYFTIDENTCKVKILFNNILSDNINLIDNELHNINNMYIKQLDRDEYKYFLKERNLKID